MEVENSEVSPKGPQVGHISASQSIYSLCVCFKHVSNESLRLLFV
jgi:hypothetical protein